MATVENEPHPGGKTRRERARETRVRVLTSAHRLFVEQGYPSTTMEAIAADAGVAVQSVYYTFKTKSLLLREAVEIAGAGRPNPLPVIQRPWMQEAMAETRGDRALALAVEHGVDIYVRAAPLWPALHAATLADADVEAYFHTMAANRRAGMEQLVRRLAEIGYLRPGLPVSRATDIVYALFSHETYLALGRDAHWSTEDYKAWLWTTLRAQLSAPGPAPVEVLRGLSYDGHQA
jgi:AcrR family transcriptional regulator